MRQVRCPSNIRNRCRKGLGRKAETVRRGRDSAVAHLSEVPDGCSSSQIQQELEVDRVPTAQVQRWSYQVIRNILTKSELPDCDHAGQTFTTDCISKRVKKNTESGPEAM